jgi:hypothetical protein
VRKKGNKIKTAEQHIVSSNKAGDIINLQKKLTMIRMPNAVRVCAYVESIMDTLVLSKK